MTERKYEYVAIVGSRDYPRMENVHSYIASAKLNVPGDGTVRTVIVSGGARGVDSVAVAFAAAHGIPAIEIPANWNIDGKAAGFIRNAIIVDLADRVVAFWDGKSNGTKHTIGLARRAGKPVEVIGPD